MAWLYLISLLMLGGLIALVAFYTRAFSESGEVYDWPWFRSWLIRGAAAPIFIWILLNWGRMPFMPPLNPYIAQLRNKGGYAQALAIQMLLAALPIIAYWSTLSFGWFWTAVYKRAKNNEDLIIAVIVWTPLMLPVFYGLGYYTGLFGIGFAGILWTWPLTQYALSVADTRKPAPAYSRAVGKIKFGKYAEAEIAIIRELEKSETDFAGWMMLAELYARQYRDLAEAEKTISDLCADPATTPSQISHALHSLSDWYLKLANDPLAARRVLQDLADRMPGTHLALMARQQMNQIPATRAEFEEQQKPHIFAMPALNDSLDESPAANAEPVNRDAAANAANELVARLTLDPNDTAAREKLARIFAQLEKFPLAIEQLELLLDLPGLSERKIPEWLASIAAWQIKLHGEGDEAKNILQRLIREFPQSPQAFAAQRRLNLINLSTKMRRPLPPIPPIPKRIIP